MFLIMELQSPVSSCNNFGFYHKWLPLTPLETATLGLSRFELFPVALMPLHLQGIAEIVCTTWAAEGSRFLHGDEEWNAPLCL